MIIAMFKQLFLALTVLSFAIPNAFAQTDAESVGVSAGQPKVLMYVMPNCGYCAKARQYFHERGVTFSEVDVAANEANNQQWRADGGQGTPLILIGAAKIMGFNQAAIDRALATSDHSGS